MISDNDLAKIIHINHDGNLPAAVHVADGRYRGWRRRRAA